MLLGLGPFSVGLTAVGDVEPAGRVALWLYCDDVDAEIEVLSEAGVEITREPEDMEWGERMATVLDPDGTRSTSASGRRAPCDTEFKIHSFGTLQA